MPLLPSPGGSHEPPAQRHVAPGAPSSVLDLTALTSGLQAAAAAAPSIRFHEPCIPPTPPTAGGVSLCLLLPTDVGLSWKGACESPLCACGFVKLYTERQCLRREVLPP